MTLSVELQLLDNSTFPKFYIYNKDNEVNVGFDVFDFGNSMYGKVSTFEIFKILISVKFCNCNLKTLIPFTTSKNHNETKV